MDVREIKTYITNLEKAKADSQIIEILTILKKDLKPTEKLLRETKVGVAVNKLKSSSNVKIQDLVKRIIKSWKDEVTREKKLKSSSPQPSQPKPINSSTDTKLKFEGQRSAQKDGVNTSIYEHSTRNAIVKALYDGLCIESQFPSNQLLKVSKEIENEVFKLEKLETNPNYSRRLRTLISNIRQKNNPELRLKLSNGDLEPNKFILMNSKELAPESLKAELEKIKQQNLHNAQGVTLERAVTDRFTCGKCKEKKVSYYQLQTRSADEPLTTFCTCENCGNRWKFS
ncbi:hypothetical protein WICMUC_005140 [Wickerhamomyces mucosus]|uniref:Transcription elongation factor n=1 Tax=Wickerhamomyces mucosus TaxID=1378264 RepID=A0A9P8P9T1_9ASCO|nr:hypothetical protein WICMUC_005140 [Wickerhamomyces mucosus]